MIISENNEQGKLTTQKPISEIRWMNMVFFLIMLFTNILSNLLPLGGNTTGEVSARYENLFTPAPYTFTIWGLIYLLLFLFILSDFIPGLNYHRDERLSDSIGIWFTVSCIANTLWILCWQFDLIGLSVLCMAALLISLIVIDLKLTGITAYSFSEQLHIGGFHIYLGWICAAFIANISAFLIKCGISVSDLAQQIITSILLLIGAALAISFIIFGQKFSAALAVVWAYVGIFIKHVSPAGYHMAYQIVICTLIISIFGILLLMKAYVSAVGRRSAV